MSLGDGRARTVGELGDVRWMEPCRDGVVLLRGPVGAQQVTLVALMWVGRGDYAVEEWDSAIENAQDSWNERTAEYLLGTPLVADYLSEGLDGLGYD